MAWNSQKQKSEVEEQLNWPGDVVAAMIVLFLIVASVVIIKLINCL